MNIKQKSNTQTLALVVTLMTILGGLFTGASYLFNTVATKSDIQAIKTDIGDLRIDSSIAFITLMLNDLDRITDKTPAELREMEVLNQQLLEFELKKIRSDDG